MGGHPAQWTFPTSFTRSNLDVFQLFWKHWIQLIQSYNFVFQSMWDSQCIYVDSSEKRIATRSDFWYFSKMNDSRNNIYCSIIIVFKRSFNSMIKFVISYRNNRLQVWILQWFINVKNCYCSQKQSFTLLFFQLFLKHWIQLRKSLLFTMCFLIM